MTVLRLSALALATTLALTGCGGDDNDSGSGTGGTITDSNLSELSQAKQLISTAKLFVNDGNAVKSAYEGTADLLTKKQSDRLSYVFHVPDELLEYMVKKNLTKLTGAQIIALADDNEFDDILGNYKLSPESDFEATVDANKHLNLSGTTQIKVLDINYRYNLATNKWEEIVAISDTFNAKFSGYKDNSASLISNTNHEGNISFDAVEYGAGNEIVKFTAGDNGLKAVGNFSKAIALDNIVGLDLNEVQEKGIVLKKGVYTLDSVKMEANDAVVEAKNFEFASLNVQNTLDDGTVVNRQLPYSIKLTGDIKKQSPKTNATVTLNMVADENDAKNYIMLNSDNKFVEADNKFVDMTALLSVKGEVAKEGGAAIPLDFQANLKRTARNVIVLDKLTATVEGKTLFVTGQTNLDNNYDTTGTTLVVKQNNAHITLKMDAESEFITDSNNKLADIMVGEKDFGDLYDNNSRVTAFFTDNSTELL